ncbi:MAG: alpha/beta fold hydrolase, partial [Anaerolineae bacterium]|nr:alpha/beta fold hydrolase [Anaerolineae bacterium]
YTPSPTWTPTPSPTATPTPANVIYSTGLTEAFGPEYPNCIQAGPTAPEDSSDRTEVLLVWQGMPTMAKLTFWFAGNNNRHHSVLVNGHVIGQLPGDDYHSVCTGGTYGEISFDPSLVVSGINEISILADVPGELNSWSLQAPQIQLAGYVQGTEIEVLQIPSSYGERPTVQRAMVQKPIGYTPGAVDLPLVVALHGWGGRDFDSLKWLARACSDRGWLLACSDTRGKSQHTPSKAVQHDVIDLVNYLISSPEYSVDRNRVYLVGPSMGGMMAATIAAKYPDYFAALVELKGPTRLDQWYWEVDEYHRERLRDELNGTPYTTPFSYQRKSAAAMPMNLRNVPTLIIHGLDDTLVPYHHAEDLYQGMLAYQPKYVRLVSYEGGHGDDPPNWGPAEILDFFSQWTLETCPLTVTVRTDEPKAYYWLDISHVASDHWTQANAWFNPDTKTITVEVRDERIPPVPVDVTLDLQRMGLPLQVAYTVEDLNVTTGDFQQYTVQADTHLRLNVPGDHHRLVAYPFAAPQPQQLVLRQGEGGYNGVEDTYIEVHSPNANHENEVLRISGGGGRVPLLRFDLEGKLSGQHPVIKAAQLGLFASSKWYPDDRIETTIYRLLEGWDVHTVTWGERSSGVPWEEAGAMGAGKDYDPTPCAIRWLEGTGEWYRYNVTNLVQQWVADPASNHGLLIRSEDGAGTFTMNSSESPMNKPELVVFYAEATITPTPTNTPIPTATPSPTSLPLRKLWLPAILK